ncbi:MAG: hypothetical protein H6706_17790 [Myxococcales bacterium]|nr:hypothetical protein [Myxococcales bacterium]
MGLTWLLAAACDDASEAVGLDAAGDAAPIDAADASPPADARADARPRPVDASLPPLRETVRTCAGACGQQTRCGSAPPGCEAACAAADEADQAAWFACLSTPDCAVIDRCALPRPEAPDCPALCEAACDLPDCAARCAAARPGFQACRGLRDCGAHRACLDRAAWPACTAVCERAAACGAGSAGPCTLACSAPPGDPLRDARQAAWRACLADAPDCDAYRWCAWSPAARRPATFCAAWQACGLGGEAVCRAWVGGQSAATFACAAATLEAGCPADGLPALEARCGARAASCRAACEASRLCGVLDAAAADACQAACEGVPRRPSAACGDAESCAALTACRAEHDPALVCPAHCATLDACGAGGADCHEACAADFDTYRARDLRHCVQVAPDCDATLACVAARPDPCDAVCERFGACYDYPGCADDCASVPVDDGGDGLRYLACLATSRTCLGPQGLAACGADVAAGDACLGYCLARGGCDPPTADLSPCLAACRDGLPPDEAARFSAAWPCLRVAPPGHCPSAAACLAPAAAPRLPGRGGRLGRLWPGPAGL